MNANEQVEVAERDARLRRARVALEHGGIVLDRALAVRDAPARARGE